MQTHVSHSYNGLVYGICIPLRVCLGSCCIFRRGTSDHLPPEFSNAETCSRSDSPQCAASWCTFCRPIALRFDRRQLFMRPRRKEAREQTLYDQQAKGVMLAVNGLMTKQIL